MIRSGGSRVSHRVGVDLKGGRELLRELRFENFVCRNEGIWTHRGHAPGTSPSRCANDSFAIFSFNVTVAEYE